ncbi:MAG: response regulator transcription factor [Clostridia bacterium]|nr:response regulator transcription factor [Clostridia bacterium]
MIVLLAEDDQKIAKLIIGLLVKDGYQVDHANDGEEALLYCENNVYDVIILDWMMPVLDGLETCVKLREKGYSGAILMLTAKDTLNDKVMGLESGADDYLIKPFEYRELLARLKVLARRSTLTLKNDIVIRDNISLNRATNTVYIDNIDANLSRREYQIFSMLFENAGQVIPRDVLIDRVWGMDGEVTSNNLDAHIRLLRKKIEKNGKKLIVNVRGIGYKMEDV